MALSAGTRQAVGMATGWLLVACAATVCLIYFSEIKTAGRALDFAEVDQAESGCAGQHEPPRRHADRLPRTRR